MLTVNEQRMQKIRQKCRQYRRQYENRRLGELACSCVFLVLCIFSVLKEAGVSGSSAVTGAYSSVVLHNASPDGFLLMIQEFSAGVQNRQRQGLKNCLQRYIRKERHRILSVPDLTMLRLP